MTATTTPLDRLTARQRVVLAFVLAGLSPKEIAYRMDVHEQTIKRHLRDAANRAGILPCGHRVTRLAALTVVWTGRMGREAA